jgi:two-component system OmpR family response regulator
VGVGQQTGQPLTDQQGRRLLMHVAIIEDDPAIARAVATALRERGHTCRCIESGTEAIADNAVLAADLVVLDSMLPGTTGIDVLRTARSAGVRTPVIMLTAKGTLPDKLEGFDAGCDDYLVKPFSIDELLVRVEVLHRRTADRPAPELAAGDLRLNLAAKRVTIGSREVDLTPTELSILELLIRYRGQVVTRKMLCEHVWGFDWDGPTNVIEVHITRLRAKLDKGRNESCILTVRGRGYALADS